MEIDMLNQIIQSVCKLGKSYSEVSSEWPQRLCWDTSLEMLLQSYFTGVFCCADVENGHAINPRIIGFNIWLAKWNRLVTIFCFAWTIIWRSDVSFWLNEVSCSTHVTCMEKETKAHFSRKKAPVVTNSTGGLFKSNAHQTAASSTQSSCGGASRSKEIVQNKPH